MLFLNELQVLSRTSTIGLTTYAFLNHADFLEQLRKNSTHLAIIDNDVLIAVVPLPILLTVSLPNLVIDLTTCFIEKYLDQKYTTTELPGTIRI